MSTDTDKSGVDNEKLRAVKKMVEAILEKAYGGSLSVIALGALPEKKGLKGFCRDDSRFMAFKVDWFNFKLTYQLVSSSNLRLDRSVIRVDKADKCAKGLSCGDACIDRKKVCSLGLSKLMSSNQLVTLRQSAQFLDADIYDTMTIRQLQELGRSRGVYRVNHMKKEDLTQVLRTLETDPGQQERVRKTLEKQRIRNREETAVLRNFESPESLDTVAIWEKIKKIGKMTGISPEIAVLLASALALKVSIDQYRKIEDDYRSNLQESSRMALAQSSRLRLDDIDKPNIMFTVGGFASTGSTGKSLQDELTPSDESDEEKWFNSENHIIPFEHSEFNIPFPPRKKNKDGTYTSAYMFHSQRHEIFQYMKSIHRGRNQASVDLAAQLYAYGSEYKDKPINILSHGAGGSVVNEAVEILERMKNPDGSGARGALILKRLNIVNLGSPTFGISSSKRWNEINSSTITSTQDPFSFRNQLLNAHRRARWISTVEGHEVSDYMKDPEVRHQLRQGFGYYLKKETETPTSSKPKAKKKKDEEVLNDFLTEEVENE